ncbi:hypothetical protein KI387_012413, partial [Taxus chinensis]
ISHPNPYKLDFTLLKQHTVCIPLLLVNVNLHIIKMEVATAGVWHLQRRLMEDLSGGVDPKRPLNVGFSLGTAIVVFMVLGMSALLSCCYHWKKINTLYSRHTRSNFSDTSTQTVGPDLCDAEASLPIKNLGIQQQGGRMLAVVMPGDQSPNFIACPCPRPTEEM